MHLASIVQLYVLIIVHITIGHERHQCERYHSTENKKQQQTGHFQTSHGKVAENMSMIATTEA